MDSVTLWPMPTTADHIAARIIIQAIGDIPAIVDRVEALLTVADELNLHTREGMALLGVVSNGPLLPTRGDFLVARCRCRQLLSPQEFAEAAQIMDDLIEAGARRMRDVRDFMTRYRCRVGSGSRDFLMDLADGDSPLIIIGEDDRDRWTAMVTSDASYDPQTAAVLLFGEAAVCDLCVLE